MKSVLNSNKQINKDNESHKDTLPKPNQRKKLLTMAPNPEIETNYDYVYQLKSMIADERITNIALEGDYGSGKSSIIQKLMTEKNFLKEYKPKIISFITFNPEEMAKRKIASIKKSDDKQRDNNQYSEKDEGTNDDKKQEGDHIEKDEKDSTQNANNNSFQISELIQSEIVKQLFYGEKPNATKWSNYGRIGRTYYWISAAMAALVLPLLLQPLLSFSEVCSKYAPLEIVDKLPSSFAVAITCIALFTIWFTTTFITNRLISNILNGSIKNISAKDFSVEINDHKPDFEQMVDLLINYFSQTKHKVIIFEDLDRFNNSQIFEEIKQLNTVVNNSEIVKEKITFVYAIRGSIINAPGDRTKLFDAIIPIIPFYSKSNVEAIFQEIIKDTGINNDITPAIIGSVSEYIKDIRVLYSIANNLTIYSSVFEMNDELTIKSCTSLAIIKTLYPDEYNNLTIGESYIEKSLQLIRNKQFSERKEILDKYNLRNILNKNKEQIFIEFFKDSKHHTSNARYNEPLYIDINSERYTYDNIDLMLLYKASSIIIHWTTTSSDEYDKSKIESNLRNIDAIEDYASGLSAYLKEDSLSNIAREDNGIIYSKIIAERNDKESKYPAIDILLKNNYILDGIFIYAAKTKFNQNELKIQKFIHEQIRLEKMNESRDVLDYVDELVKKINRNDYRSIGVYNYYILDYMTQNLKNEDIDEKYKILIDNIENNKDSFYKFLYDYIERDMDSLSSFIFNKDKSIPKQLNELKDNHGSIRLLNRIIIDYPDIAIKLSIDIFSLSQSISALIINAALLDHAAESYKVHSERIDSASNFGPYIIHDNLDKYIKLLRDNNLPILSIRELIHGDKEQLLSLIKKYNSRVYLSDDNIGQLGIEGVKTYLETASIENEELLNIAKYNNVQLLQYIVNKPALIISAKPTNKDINFVYKKAINKKIGLTDEALTYCCKYIDKNSIIKAIINSQPAPQAMINTLYNSNDKELKKIKEGGYMKLDNTSVNNAFATLLVEQKMAEGIRKAKDGHIQVHIRKRTPI